MGAAIRQPRRVAVVAAVLAAPLVFAPWPFAGRHVDPLQAIAMFAARTALLAGHADTSPLAQALGERAAGATAPIGLTRVTPDASMLDPTPQTAALRPVAPTALAYAPEPTALDPLMLADPASALGVDIAALREGVDLYRKGDVAGGDAAAQRAKGGLAATTLAWTWLKTHPREAGIERAARFIADHPDWPGNDWLRRRIEDGFYGDRVAAAAVRKAFAERAPETTLGRIAFAKALADTGEDARALSVIRAVWAKDELPPATEAAIRKTFGDRLTLADHKLRAERFLYKEDGAAAIRIATQAGDKDLLAYVKVRAAAQDGPLSDKLLATIPAKYAGEAGLVFSKAQLARRAGRIEDAAALIEGAPRDPALIVDGDEWWVERRLVSRKLLDMGQVQRAYALCAAHSATSPESRIEAEFHAGWIALRFLNDAARAKPHFATLASLSQSPASRARAAYWQGRAAEAANEPAGAFYEAAARWPATYYGQKAREKLPAGATIPADATPAAEREERVEAVRVVEALYLAGAKDLAVSLATDAARNLRDVAQLKALARIVARDRDAKVSLAVGKLASQRGYPLDELAFPTYGVPAFTPLPNSAPLPVVYAIARQESAFDPQALSSAGAMGLMQMIASTAKRTAQRAGLAFDASRMRAEPAFNAQLGAAHLGDLLEEQAGSTILTFAAYNAGGKRVKEWIAAYGDPRSGEVDPIDWVERIPFTETRNYVQRVTENLAVYTARLAAAMKPAPAAATAGEQPRPDAQVATAARDKM